MRSTENTSQIAEPARCHRALSWCPTSTTLRLPTVCSIFDDVNDIWESAFWPIELNWVVSGVPAVPAGRVPVVTILTQLFSIAYWIAFGPHGPRAADPPGHNARVAWGVVVGLGVSVAIFSAIRLFARPPPSTMTKEYQEATNELLLVCPNQFPSALTRFSRANAAFTATKSRSPYRYRLRGLRGQGRDPVSPQGQLKSKHNTHYIFFFVIEAGADGGALAVREAVLEEHGVWRSCAKARVVSACKYCTTTQKTKVLVPHAAMCYLEKQLPNTGYLDKSSGHSYRLALAPYA